MRLDLGPTSRVARHQHKRGRSFTLLALHVDTQYLAYAVFRSGAPIAYEIVRLHRGEMNRTLRALIRGYRPSMIVRNRPTNTLALRSRALRENLEAIDHTAATLGLRVHSYSLAQVWERLRPLSGYLETRYAALLPPTRGRIGRIALAVSVLFQPISRFLKPLRLGSQFHFRDTYYRRLFFAVGLGVTHHLRTNRPLEIGFPSDDMIERTLAAWRN